MTPVKEKWDIIKNSVITELIEKYRAESLDIDDIEYEDADIQWAEYEEVREDETDSPNL